MQSENNTKPADTGVKSPAGEETLDGTLDWLLDQDLTDPAETLFTVDAAQFVDPGLSETEAAMAARPMFGSNQQADSLEGFVEEEIVLSSVGESSDIYQAQEETPADTGPDQTPAPAVVINPNGQTKSSAPELELDEGLDILGLQEDDDIGDKPLVIQRSGKPARHTRAEPESPAEKAPQQPESDSSEDVVAAVADQDDSGDNTDAGELTMEEAVQLDAVGGVGRGNRQGGEQHRQHLAQRVHAAKYKAFRRARLAPRGVIHHQVGVAHDECVVSIDQMDG